MASFLQTLFGQKPPELYVLLWSLRGKASSWFQDIEAADRHVSAQAKQDLYVGVGLSPKDFGRGARCEAAQVAGIVGLWADVDVADPLTHKKAALPPTKDVARAFLDGLPLRPTLIVDSGHGLQPWWLLVEPWLFADGAERERAAALATAWTKTLRAVMGRSGWSLDATQDLSRILRIPGTTNCKVKGAEVPVTLLVPPEGRPLYNPSDFDEYLIDDEGPAAPRKAYARQLEGVLELSAQASPPFDKFQALLENDQVARRTWEGKRKDKPSWSASEYDLSMATQLAQTWGWTDQEICDTLVARRRAQKDDLKLRQDYYAGTIAKARAAAARGAEDDEAGEQIDRLDDAGAPLEPQQRGVLLDELERRLGYRVLGVEQHDAVEEEPDFYLLLPERRAFIGKAGTLNKYGAWQDRVNPHVAHPLPLAKKDFDGKISPLLWRIRQIVPQGTESTVEGFVQDYTGEREPKAPTLSGVIDRLPFVERGKTYLFLADFCEWLRKARGESVTAKRAASWLRNIGGAFEHHDFYFENRHYHRGVWELPVQLGVREEEEEAQKR